MPAPRQAAGPLRIVAIGGGTGLSTLLKGLKRYVPAFDSGRGWLSPAVQITAVVTATDDGGSSGRLRREFDILPPGDIRNCMVALSEDEMLLAKLFQHRFSAGRGLKGHSFGNLFLAALTQITGDFPKAVRLSSEVLAIAGDIFPSTAANVTLKAHLRNGQTVTGESRISRSESPIELIELEPPDVKPMAETLAAIREADVITFGPGSLYTSVAPNLLVAGIPQAIQHSPAVKACLVNLMSQPGETTGMSAADHVEAVLKHAGRALVDCAVVNTAPVSKALLARYARTQAMPVFNDLRRIEALGVKIVGLPLLAPGTQVRHDSDLLARAVVGLARGGRRRRLLGQAKTAR
ncbi:MAG: YvcK family protein [Acidobacteria bacterium]|nr:YvcK family protein [Acidobacteriota bacterium]